MTNKNLRAETFVTNKVDIRANREKIPAGTSGIIESVDSGEVVWVVFERDHNGCTDPVWCHVSELNAI